jgi:hypothetical protein
MNIWSIKKILGVVFFWGALLMGMTVANATVITSGCLSSVSCSLQELVDGGTITVNDKLFDNWFALDFSTQPVDLDGVSVTGLDDQPLNPGLQYDGGGQLVANDFDLIDLNIKFSVATLDGVARIKDVSLEIDVFEFGTTNFGGFIDIFEDVFDSTGSTLIVDPLVFADNLLLQSPIFLMEQILFPSPPFSSRAPFLLAALTWEI